MSRRARLPGADELFRATGGGAHSGAAAAAPLTMETAPAGDGDARPASWGEPADPRDGDRRRAGSPDLSIAPGLPTPIDTDGQAEAPPVRAVRFARTAERRPSGRQRHDEKITVYCSAEELIDLEQARLTLRGEHGLAIDRGRIVREAVAVVLADLEAKGEASILVRRLRGR